MSASQQSTQVLSSMHMDYVMHVAFDMYGRRMATCSGDRFVRVWDLSSDNEWALSGEWQAHRGSVNQLAWAHAEFGPLVATCGSDSDVKIFEERGGETSSKNIGKRWVQMALLPEARRSVACCQFAPRQWGLKLATGSSDGCVRIYECVDTMNLSQWPLQATLSAFPNHPLGVTCLSWCFGRFEPPTLVVGGSHLIVYRYLSNSWKSVLTLDQQSSSSSSHVLDVAWAPNLGRRFHWIAAAHGNELRLYKLVRSSADKNGQQQQQQQLELTSTQTLPSSLTIWRCQWNVTGTVLACSGDGGVVQLYKCDFNNNWKCVSQIHGDLGLGGKANNGGGEGGGNGNGGAMATDG
jgi:nucleoporin SEH1